ncbi:MAG TPA: hypothetical protein VF146_06000 [Bryobacteraceae bacterium]
MLDRYVIPLTPYLLVTLLTAMGLLSFASLQREIARLKARLRTQSASDLVAQQELRSKLDYLNARVRDAEERAQTPTQAIAIRPSLNVNKRAQALRLLGRGTSPANIAASLQLPQNQVELLVKIRSLELDRPPQNEC